MARLGRRASLGFVIELAEEKPHCLQRKSLRASTSIRSTQEMYYYGDSPGRKGTESKPELLSTYAKILGCHSPLRGPYLDLKDIFNKLPYVAYHCSLLISAMEPPPLN